jgi:putative membrane protein
MKALTIFGAVVTTVAILASVVAAQVPLPVTQLISDQDREFVRKAVTGGVAEVDYGRIAQSRAARSSVHSLADRMVTDHGRINAELASLARSKNIDVPTALEASQRAMRDRLSGLSGPDFDRAYMTEVVRDHTEDVALFERAAELANDPDIKTWAGRTLPMLRDHLALARQINSEVVLGPPVSVPAALPAAVVIPWCEGVYAPAAGTNFGGCAVAK